MPPTRQEHSAYRTISGQAAAIRGRASNSCVKLPGQATVILRCQIAAAGSSLPLLQAPREGLLFDVAHNEFWPGSWGPRPSDPAAAAEAASVRLATWPRLVPLYGHRYLPPGPSPSPSPVLSVVQSDVIYYGRDLLAWVQRECLGVPLPEQPRPPDVPFWSKLAEGWADHDF